MDEKLYEFQRFECECASFEHTFRMILDKEDGRIWIDVPLNPFLPWHKRLFLALRYVFSPGKSKNGEYDSVSLEPKDHDRIIGLLNRSRRIRDERRPEHR